MIIFKILLFVYQPKFNKLDVKKDKGTEYAIGLKSKGVCNFKHTT